MKLNLLRKDLEKKLGQSISSKKDAIALETAIYEETGLMVSYNTIRRFFGLAKGGEPRESVLNIYAKYLGFSDLVTYQNDKERFSFYNEWSQITQRERWTDQEISSLVKSAMEEDKNAQGQLMWALNELFTNAPISEWARWFDFPEWNRGEHSFGLVKFYIDSLGGVIRSRITSKDLAQELISHASLVSRIVFLFVDYSSLQSGYYFKVINALHEAATDRLFTTSVLGMRAFWLGDLKQCDEYFTKVSNYQVDHSLYPILNSRIFAAQIYLDWRHIGLLAPATYQAIIEFLNQTDEERYHLALMELLPMAAVLGFSNEVMSIYILLKNKMTQMIDWSAMANKDLIRLSYMIALANAGLKAEFEEVAEELKPNNWYLSYKKHFRALHGFAERRLGKASITFEAELKNFAGLNSLN